MKSIGIDIHLEVDQVAILDDSGKFEDHQVTTCSERQALVELVRLEAPDVIVMEACTGAFRVYDQLSPHCRFIQIVDAKLFRQRYPKRSKKTDQIDARNLALYGVNGAETIWIPDEKVRQARLLANDRVTLTELRVQAKNVVQARLRDYGLKKPKEIVNLWTHDGMNWLFKQLAQLPTAIAVSIDIHLRLFQQYQEVIDDLDRQIAEVAKVDPGIELLMSIPGIDYYSAFVIKSEIGDHRRFDSAKKLVSYAGLNPRVHQSGKRCIMGSISKEGRRRLRWMVVECGLVAAATVPVLKSFHDRIKKRTRVSGKAKVAVGRKLLELIWHILRTGRPYDHSKAELHAKKITRMRKRATAYTMTRWAVANRNTTAWRSGALATSPSRGTRAQPPSNRIKAGKAVLLDSQMRG